MRDPLRLIKTASSLAAVKFLGRRIPIYCEWEVCSRCNMNCYFCSTKVEDRNNAPESSPERALEIVSQLASLGTKMMHLSGGEPTLRKDLPDIIAAAQARGMIVAMTSNGSAKEETLRKISAADLIRISVDGPREFHDKARGCPGAYEKAMSALKFLRGLGKRPHMTSVFTPDSTPEMMRDLASICKEVGAQLAISVLGKKINNPNEHRPEDLRSRFHMDYIEMLDSLRKEFGSVVANPEPFISVIKAGGLDAYGCRAMDAAICIKADGSMAMPCNGLVLERADGDLKAAYRSKEALKARASQGVHPLCKGCNIRCMCSASGMLRLDGLISIFDSYIRNIAG